MTGISRLAGSGKKKVRHIPVDPTQYKSCGVQYEMVSDLERVGDLITFFFLAGKSLRLGGSQKAKLGIKIEPFENSQCGIGQ